MNPDTTGVRTFEIGSCVGKGGFGEVYRAQMVSAGGLRREVAVKTLLTGPAVDREAIQRLRDEAKLLAALNHRSILLVHDLVILEDRLALVSEYVDGQDLDTCAIGPDALPHRAAVEVIGEVAGALHAAWSTPAPGSSRPMRLVHRDIKPANIRIGKNGTVKLLDFGIARSPEVEREAKTGTGLVVGTIGFLAPERLTAEGVRPPSDVYALGCVLYEALGGFRLFGNVHKAQLTRMAVVPEDHTEFLEDMMGALSVPGALADLLWRMLAHDEQQRPSAAEVERCCEDLVATLEGPTLRQWCRDHDWAEPEEVDGELVGRQVTETTLATRRTYALTPEPPVHRPPTAPRTALWAGGLAFTLVGMSVALLALLIILGGVGWYWSTSPPAPPAPTPVASSPPADPKPIQAPAPPEPGPVPRPRRATIPSPASAPAPAPASAPSPEPVHAPAGATVTADGARVQLRGPSGTFGPGPVPAGEYRVYADFGNGWVRTDPIVVPASGTLSLQCSSMMLKCRKK